MKHTPGPWNVFPTGIEGKHGPTVSIDKNPLKIIARPDWHGDHQEYLANATLIAAAPDLLEALQSLMADLQDAGDDRNPENGNEYAACINAREAIAKATGETV